MRKSSETIKELAKIATENRVVIVTAKQNSILGKHRIEFKFIDEEVYYVVKSDVSGSDLIEKFKVRLEKLRPKELEEVLAISDSSEKEEEFTMLSNLGEAVMFEKGTKTELKKKMGIVYDSVWNVLFENRLIGKYNA